MSRSERSLDAAKRSRKIEHRSDANRVRLPCRKLTRLWSTIKLASGHCFRETATSSRADFSDHQTRAPAHHGHDMWGVSDPAESARGRGRSAEAGSLTPHFCSDSCAGALSGRHKTPPTSTSAVAQRPCNPATCEGEDDRAWIALANATVRSSRFRGGQPRIGVASPSSAPRIGTDYMSRCRRSAAGANVDLRPRWA